MGIIITISLNWFAAGVCFSLFIALLTGKSYGYAALNAALCVFNAALGIMNISRLLAAIEFVADMAK